METLIHSFDDFWPYYVRQHLHPVNRALHFLGTTLALLSLATAVALTSPVWLVTMLVAGYGPAWVGHFFFEKNEPATFRYPLWSLRGDFRMYRLTWTGRMEAEAAKAVAAARA